MSGRCGFLGRGRYNLELGAHYLASLAGLLCLPRSRLHHMSLMSCHVMSLIILQHQLTLFATGRRLRTLSLSCSLSPLNSSATAQPSPHKRPADLLLACVRAFAGAPVRAPVSAGGQQPGAGLPHAPAAGGCARRVQPQVGARAAARGGPPHGTRGVHGGWVGGSVGRLASQV